MYYETQYVDAVFSSEEPTNYRGAVTGLVDGLTYYLSVGISNHWSSDFVWPWKRTNWAKVWTQAGTNLSDWTDTAQFIVITNPISPSFYRAAITNWDNITPFQR